MNLAEALPIGLLGALLGLDVVSFPQAMISRPIVAATAAGAFIGNPPAGLLIGVVLEMIALDTLPFGASRYPEWGSAGVVGGSLFAAQSASMPGALPASLLAALLTASISGWSMKAISKVFDLTPKGIINALDLRKPIYSPTAAYGHFGRAPKKNGKGTLFTWERLDRVADLRKAVETR